MLVSLAPTEFTTYLLMIVAMFDDFKLFYKPTSRYTMIGYHEDT